VGEGAFRAGQALDCEPDAAAFLPDLVGEKAADRDARVAKQLGEAAGDRRLAGAGPALEEDSNRVMSARSGYGTSTVKRLSIVTGLILFALAAPSLVFGSHSGSAGGPRDFVTGSGTNQFLVAIGEAHLSVAAHAGPTGHVRAMGDPDGAGPMEPFALEGEVTCLRVDGNRAAIKYRFKHAEGSAEPFQDGGVQIFIEDNGRPGHGAVDRTTFDPPQPAGVFDLAASQCDDPNSRFGYDGIESGNFTVHDAS
jgi:hypothetical protein